MIKESVFYIIETDELIILEALPIDQSIYSTWYNPFFKIKVKFYDVIYIGDL